MSKDLTKQAVPKTGKPNPSQLSLLGRSIRGVSQQLIYLCNHTHTQKPTNKRALPTPEVGKSLNEHYILFELWITDRINIKHWLPMERMIMMMMMTNNRPLKGRPFGSKGLNPADTLLCVRISGRKAGDVRESRLGFGCQPVFSAIISSRVSRYVPADPAPFLSPGRCAQAHISKGGGCTCSGKNTTAQP